MSKGEHTPTPWHWQDFGRGLILVSEASGKPIVMDFIRQGMNGAEPRFGKRTDSMGGIMVPLSKWEAPPPDLIFIVHAVNVHDALVDACRQFVHWYAEDSTEEKRDNAYDAARVALALAEKDLSE